MTEIVPVVDGGLGNSSYVVETGDGEAVVIDPFRDPRPYLRIAAERGWRLRASLETHLHADFVSGSRELAAAAGSEIWVPTHEAIAFPARQFAGDEQVALGGLTLQVVATPGHTPEHVAYVLLDDGEPVGVFSGGTLIVGGVARPDLLGEELTEPLARHAYRSIHQRLLALPDDTALYPTHGPGSFCSGGSSGERISTIGNERHANPLLQHTDEDAFVDALVSALGSYPPFFLELRRVNVTGPRTYGPEPSLPPQLTPDEAEALIAGGAEPVDIRSIEAFAAGHVPGSLSNALRDQFAVWLGWLVPRQRDVLLVADSDADIDRATSEARKVGFENLVGVLDIDRWQVAGKPTATVPLQTAEQAAAEGRRPLDVRQTSEHQAGAVPGAAHVELGALPDVAPPVEGAVVAHCGHGERAMTAASLLARRGMDATALAGGPDDLAEALDTEVELSA